MTIYSQLCSSGGPAEKERRPRGIAWLEGLDPEAPPGGRSRSDPGTPCVFLRGSTERGFRTSTVRRSRLDAAAAKIVQREEPLLLLPAASLPGFGLQTIRLPLVAFGGRLHLPHLFYVIIVLKKPNTGFAGC